ncbi:hypothetical protein ACET3Z_017422 [Daucus carota]
MLPNTNNDSKGSTFSTWTQNFPQDSASTNGPKYNGKYLKSIIKDLLDTKTMNQTLADVIIPTFDIKLIQPMVFSTSDAKIETSMNALLADVCVATSAAPTFLPAYYFETKHEDGKARSFNLIDGGVAAFELWSEKVLILML